MKRKISYQSKPKEKILIVLTGELFLQYRDAEIIGQAAKGDMLVWPQNDALKTTRQGAYDETGFSGYFKVDVHDGGTWRPVILNEIFRENEHHFRKTERPIDTYAFIAGILRALAGKSLLRTYREHYELDSD